MRIINRKCFYRAISLRSTSLMFEFMVGVLDMYTFAARKGGCHEKRDNAVSCCDVSTRMIITDKNALYVRI